jgi:GAF domain-containing protein/HAMP domain-containing protein
MNGTSNKQTWSQRLIRASVTTKFLVALGIILTVVAIIQIAYAADTTRLQIENEEQEKLDGFFEVYEAHVEAETNASAVMALSLAARSDIQEMYLRKDRDGMYELLRPMFEEMEQRRIQHLYIHNPDGTVFLRVHNRNRFGDDATYRPTLQDSLEQKIVTSGIDIGPNRLGIRGVAPMYSDGKFIGLVEVGIDFDETLTNTLKQFTGADYTMWVSYDSAAPAGLQPVDGVPASPFDKVFYYAGTTKDLPPVESSTYQNVFETGQAAFQVFTRNVSVPSAVYIVPMNGYDGKQFGLMQIAIPYTEVIQQQNNATFTIALVTAGLTLLGLFLIALFNRQVVLRPLQILTSFAESQLSGKLEERVTLETGDEFQQLAATFNTLAATVQEDRRQLEQRITDRTQALAHVAEIGTATSAIRDLEKMLMQFVYLTQRRFGLYHAHIFLYDEETDNLRIIACGWKEGDEHEGTHGTTTIPLTQEQSLVARAARSKHPVIVNDVRSDPGWLPNPLMPDTASELAVPLLIGDRLIGVLDVQSEQLDAFTEADADVQLTLSAQAAVAIENIRQFENTQKVASDLGVVAQVGIATATITDIGKLLQEVVDLSKESFNLYHAHIYMVNEAGDALELAAGAGEVGRQMVAEKRSIPMNAEQSLVVRAAVSQQGVIANDVAADPNFLPNPLLPETRAEMAVPMIVSKKVIGVLDVQSETIGRFTEVDVNIKTTLASQIAMAVQNARNLDQSRRQAERETAVNLIGQKIQSATNIAAALQVAARELGHALGMKQTLVLLGDSTPDNKPQADAS